MLQDLPPAFFQLVSAEFDGERILWAGRPDAFKSFLMLTPVWLFAVPWTVFAVGWEYIALSAYFSEGKQALDGAGKVMGVVFPIFGLPFVLIGLGMMSGPFWGWWKTRRTVFVLTDQRLATVVARRGLNVTSVDILQVSSVHRIEKANGSGTLHLHLGSYRDSDGDLVEKKVTIPGVPDVRELERLVIAAIRDKQKS